MPDLYEVMKRAKCPDCDGDGVIYDDRGIEPCGWCHQREEVMAKVHGEEMENPIMPDTTNPYNCQPHLEDAFSEVLAGMSKEEQVEVARMILVNRLQSESMATFVEDVCHWMQDAAHEEGNY